MTTFDKRFKESVRPEPREDGAVPFFVDTGGAGDLIVALGFVRGYRKVGIPSWVVTRRNDYRSLLSVLLEEPKDDDEGAIRTGGSAYYYRDAMPESGEKSFVGYVRSQLPHQPEWVHPTITPTAEDKQWALSLYKQAEGLGKRVLLAPFAAWHARNWPLSYWSDLAWSLKYQGYQVINLLPRDSQTGEGKDDAHKTLTASIWGISWAQSAALAATADLVISNDSGTAHLGGAAGVTTLALCGSTAGMFDQYPSVRELHLAREELGCVGCWFVGDRGYRSACDKQCEALMRMPSSAVLQVAKWLLTDGNVPSTTYYLQDPLPHTKVKTRSTALTVRGKVAIHASAPV